MTFAENREIVADLRSESGRDWLLVAGDVGEIFADIEWALAQLRERFAVVVWVPGNHELWTHPKDPVTLRGEERYHALVSMCRRLGVHTPEDPYPVWPGPDGPVVVAPLFVLYDYTFLPPAATSKEEALALAREAGVVCTDEYLLHPDPFDSREAWCQSRLRRTEKRLSELDTAIPTVLVNHFPLIREPTRVLRYPQFALWCGSVHTADWHLRFRASSVVYGHLHIPRTLWADGVAFHEVSLGYPRERYRQVEPSQILRQILPQPAD